MKQEDVLLNLFDTINLLDNAVHWLKRSYTICSGIGIKENYTEEEYDDLETLTSRFARVSDIIIQKVFRSIDAVEFENKGTLIDVVNRAHKRGFFESIEKLREIRELRNSIAHEYIQEGLADTFIDVLRFTPELFDIATQIKNYCKKYEIKEGQSNATNRPTLQG